MHFTDAADWAANFLSQLPDAVRQDSNVSHLQRELTSQADEIIEKYGKLKAFQLAPFNDAVDPGAEFISYPVVSEDGIAEIVANAADDLPIVDVSLSDNLMPVYTFACAWLYTEIELLRDGMLQVPKIGRKRETARKALARALDRFGMIGEASANVGGFVNDPNVPVFVLPNGDWLNAATTDAERDEDLKAFEEFVIANSGENFYPDTLAVSGDLRRVLTRKNVQTGRSIWDEFVENSQISSADTDQTWSLERTPYLTDVGGRQRMVMYLRDPEILESNAPLLYSERPAQMDNLSNKVPTMARSAGTIIKQPSGMAYADATP